MRLFTLDRLGLVKTIEFNSKTAKPAPSKKLLKKVKKEGAEVNEVEKVERLSINGNVKENICKIFLKSAKQLLFVTVLNRLYTFCLESGECVCLSDEAKNNVACESLKASYSPQGCLITCTPNGLVTYFDVRDLENVKTTRVSLGQDKLSALAIHPQFPHIFATGGNERELCVWDLSSANQEASLKQKEDPEKLMPVWKAKNVANDSLDMRVRVHVTVIIWMSKENYTDIAIATAYSQIRVYNTNKQKRPILDFQKCGTHPIKTLVHTRNNEFVYSDTLGNVSAINSTNGVQTGKFKGVAGAVIDLFACEKYPYLVTVSLDRRCKVFEEQGQRRIVKDIYLKQQLVNVIVDEKGDNDDEETANSENSASGEEEDDGEDVWEKIDKADEEPGNVGEKRKVIN